MPLTGAEMLAISTGLQQQQQQLRRQQENISSSTG
jgi:hypothetical protein